MKSKRFRGKRNDLVEKINYKMVAAGTLREKFLFFWLKEDDKLLRLDSIYP